MYTVNIGEGPTPEQEAALLRLVKTIRQYKRGVDGLAALTPARRAGSLTLKLVRGRADMTALRSAMSQDADFRGFIQAGLAREFGEGYAKTLFELFG